MLVQADPERPEGRSSRGGPEGGIPRDHLYGMKSYELISTLKTYWCPSGTLVVWPRVRRINPGRSLRPLGSITNLNTSRLLTELVVDAFHFDERRTRE